MHDPLLEVMEEPLVGSTGREVLKNIFHGAFQQAAQSLGLLIGRQTVVGRSTLRTLRGEAFFDCFEDGLDELYFASILKIDDIFGSNVILLIPAGDGIRLYRRLTGEDCTAEDQATEDVVAGIGELNNILGGAFINSLANFLKVTIHSTIPLNTLDMLGAILQDIVLQEEYLDKQILYVETAIQDADRKDCTVRLIVLSDWRRFSRILDSV